MLKKTIVIILAAAISFLFLQNCDTTEPVNGDHPDTTTQNFYFETYEFGDGYESSYFKDVWIFDENNIWAVGYIGTDAVTNANIVRWNGKKWYIEDFQGTSSGIQGIWAIDSNKIYFASGGLRKYEEGVYSNVETNLGLKQNQGIYKLWGSGSSNIWGVGPGGTIVHYNGAVWEKIDFDADWNFWDITGNLKSGIAYAVARGSGFISIIVQLDGNPEIIFNAKESSFPFHFASIEMVDDNNLYFAGVDIGIFNLSTLEAKIADDLPLGYNISSITSTRNNDIYFFGDDLGEGIYKKKLVHYNGKRFSYFDLPNREGGIIGDSDSMEDLAVSVEFSENKAYIIKINRN